MIQVDDIQAAAGNLWGVAHRTPILTSRTLDEMVGASLYLKAECFQRTGSFKFRGAYNAVTRLSAAEQERGVVAYSSGNHAQAVALASALHGVSATIVMPADAPLSKVNATRGYGAEVMTYDRYTEDRVEIGTGIARERGLVLIPPFDHPDVIAGQGTVALEMFEQCAPLDALVVCVGGGGLISGCATVAKAVGDVRVIGVEPEAGNDVQQSLLTGRIVTIETPVTIADGQQTTSPSDRTFEVIRSRVDEIVLVSDDEIVEAMRFAFERMNIVLEPSGASALAAVMAGRIDVAGQRIGITLSGGNVDQRRFSELLG